MSGRHAPRQFHRFAGRFSQRSRPLKIKSRLGKTGVAWWFGRMAGPRVSRGPKHSNRHRVISVLVTPAIESRRNAMGEDARDAHRVERTIFIIIQTRPPLRRSHAQRPSRLE